jgi:hypothetical protein
VQYLTAERSNHETGRTWCGVTSTNVCSERQGNQYRREMGRTFGKDRVATKME